MKELTIKFRGWHKKKKELISLDVICPTEIDVFIFTQYIGMLDIKRKPVFVGDIIKYNYYPNTTYSGKDTMRGVMIISDIRYCKDIIEGEKFNIEIIGNKFENPGMFKELKNGALFRKLYQIKDPF